jgi:hypothetical protein
LATLGGGAVAAGGFGIAGGTALMTGLGGITGAGAAAAGARWTPWATGQVVADAMRLDLIARCVLIEAQNRGEKQRRVVRSLQERLEKVVADGERLLDRIRELSRDNARLSAENKELREELRRQHADAKRAGSGPQLSRAGVFAAIAYLRPPVLSREVWRPFAPESTSAQAHAAYGGRAKAFAARWC